ncbi:hypothetical protein [Streptomyces sp. NPDC002990]
MTIPEKSKSAGSPAPLAGVRPLAAVDLALKNLASPPQGPEQFTVGAALAYQWALGRRARAPVTSADGRGVPDLPLLTAEVDAAVVQLDDPTTPADLRDFTRGVHDALGWVCGYSDQRP